MRRYWLPAVAVVAGLVLAVVFWRHVRNEFFVVLGNRNESGGWYGWWSGNAGGLQLLQWGALAAFLYWHHTCHDNPWCLRWGKYEAAGGMFKLCRHHHPDLKGTRPHRQMIHEMHRDWKRQR